MSQLILAFSNQQITKLFLNDQIPEWIIYLQLGLFAAWFICLIWIWVKQSIIKTRVETVRLDLISIDDIGNRLLGDRGEDKNDKGISEIVNQHLQSICNAGKDESHLDVPLLIKNTHDQLNLGSVFLRSVLSLFLILGLLGTLFGLASSLSHFSSTLLGGGQITNEILEKGLKELLNKLGGAFTPSIVGVLITIIGVLFYSLFQRLVSIPLSNTIEHKTLTEWVPKIIKTPHQNEKEGLAQLKDLIQENVRLAKENQEAVEGFQDVAETLKTEAGDLATNVKSAGETLRALRESSQNLKEFSEKFVESVKGITSFQQDLKAIYEQNEVNSAKFYETVKTILTENREFQDIVAEQFKLQSQETEKLFKRLKIYEEGYLDSRQSIDKNLNTLLETATQTYAAIQSQNTETGRVLVRALLEEVGNPLQDKMTREFGNVSNGLKEGLRQVGRDLSDELAKIDNKYEEITKTFVELVTKLGEVKIGIDAINLPIKEASTEIKGIATGFDLRTSNLLTEIQREFHNQNETTLAQLDNLTELKERIGTLNGKFDGLGVKIDSFNQEAVGLGKTISSFNSIGKATIPEHNGEPPTFWKRLKRRVHK